MITVNHLNKSFDDKQVLFDLNIAFEAGKTNLIIGQSGSGKTVLMKCVVGLMEPSSGEVMYDGRNFTTAPVKDQRILRKEIGMVFQGGALFDSMTVEENVAFPIQMFTEMNKEEMLERVNDCLSRVNLENANHKFPSEISGGMKKRVAIARAIALNPKYLFFDEPNSGLDPRTSMVIDNLIQRITEDFNTVTVVNTHDMNSVLEMGDHIVFIHKGRNHWEGTGQEIVNVNDPILSDFIFATNLMKKAREGLRIS
jgi:phospholipid/cholesterol/gamma-HCH transport system ATP-binding protein